MGETLRTLDAENLIKVRGLVKSLAERHGYAEYAEDMAQEMIVALLSGKSHKQKLIHFCHSYYEKNHKTRQGYQEIPTDFSFFNRVPSPTLSPELLLTLADLRKIASKPRNFEIWFGRVFEGKEFGDLEVEFGLTRGRLCQKFWRETERLKLYFT